MEGWYDDRTFSFYRIYSPTQMNICVQGKISIVEHEGSYEVQLLMYNKLYLLLSYVAFLFPVIQGGNIPVGIVFAFFTFLIAGVPFFILSLRIYLTICKAGKVC
ncbi:hypothetical protein RCC89_15790 [Cytophagaceae bacterium ABcell3]|nr:hypothetical protein RCC89_15790 [Cytophagaceae bacterium ABcell3]